MKKLLKLRYLNNTDRRYKYIMKYSLNLVINGKGGHSTGSIPVLSSKASIRALNDKPKQLKG